MDVGNSRMAPRVPAVQGGLPAAQALPRPQAGAGILPRADRTGRLGGPARSGVRVRGGRLAGLRLRIRSGRAAPASPDRPGAAHRVMRTAGPAPRHVRADYRSRFSTFPALPWASAAISVLPFM